MNELADGANMVAQTSQESATATSEITEIIEDVKNSAQKSRDNSVKVNEYSEDHATISDELSGIIKKFSLEEVSKDDMVSAFNLKPVIQVQEDQETLEATGS